MFIANDITVYVPYFRAESTIGQCVEALTGQSILPSRLLVIDDGSPSLLALPGIEIVRHPVNQGLAAARNTALQACRTRLIAAVDADVVAAPDWLALLLDALNQSTADARVVGVGGRLIERFQQGLADRWRAVHMAQHWGKDRVVNPRFLYGANTLLIADDARACGGYDATLRTNNEDRVLSDALYARAQSLVYVPTAVCHHLRQDDCRTILRGYWQWHHAKGLQRGDFDSPAGLLRRISEVNFGIFRYRFDLDRSAGREEFLALDAAIAWVFCALDLDFFARRNATSVPDLRSVLNTTPGHDEDAVRALNMLLNAVKAHTTSAPAPLPWHEDYVAEFRRLLNGSGWLLDCANGLAGWRDLCA